MNELERIVEWSPAWDKRNSDPSKDYGVHGMEMRFILKGPMGATQFLLYTNWMLPQNRKAWNESVNAHLIQPLPADIGYHSRAAQYEGQENISESCPYLDGVPCFYDGSGLRANDVFDRFVTEGEEAVWDELQKEYDYRFAERRMLGEE